MARSVHKKQSASTPSLEQLDDALILVIAGFLHINDGVEAPASASRGRVRGLCRLEQVSTRFAAKTNTAPGTDDRWSVISVCPHRPPSSHLELAYFMSML